MIGYAIGSIHQRSVGYEASAHCKGAIRAAARALTKGGTRTTDMGIRSVIPVLDVRLRHRGAVLHAPTICDVRYRAYARAYARAAADGLAVD